MPVIIPIVKSVHALLHSSSILQGKRSSDPKSVCSDDSTGITSSPRASRDHLNLPFLDGPSGDSSRSPSPVSEIRKPLAVTIPDSTEGTQILLASMEAGQKSPRFNNMMSQQTSGMVQVLYYC